MLKGSNRSIQCCFGTWVRDKQSQDRRKSSHHKPHRLLCHCQRTCAVNETKRRAERYYCRDWDTVHHVGLDRRFKENNHATKNRGLRSRSFSLKTHASGPQRNVKSRAGMKPMNHYFMINLNIRDKRFEVLDSLRNLKGKELDKCAKEIVTWIILYWESQYKTPIDTYKLINIDVPNQDNSDDRRGVLTPECNHVGRKTAPVVRTSQHPKHQLYGEQRSFLRREYLLHQHQR